MLMLSILLTCAHPSIANAQVLDFYYDDIPVGLGVGGFDRLPPTSSYVAASSQTNTFSVAYMPAETSSLNYAGGSHHGRVANM